MITLILIIALIWCISTRPSTEKEEKEGASSADGALFLIALAAGSIVWLALFGG